MSLVAKIVGAESALRYVVWQSQRRLRQPIQPPSCATLRHVRIYNIGQHELLVRCQWRNPVFYLFGGFVKRFIFPTIVNVGVSIDFVEVFGTQILYFCNRANKGL